LSIWAAREARIRAASNRSWRGQHWRALRVVNQEVEAGGEGGPQVIVLRGGTAGGAEIVRNEKWAENLRRHGADPVCGAVEGGERTKVARG